MFGVNKRIRGAAVGLLLLLICCCLSPIVALAERVTEEREVEPFHSVDLRTVGHISLTQGDEQSIVIRAERDILQKLKTEARDGELIISSKWNIRQADAPEISITITKVRSLKISGSGEIKGEERILSKDLDLGISGSGDIVLELKAEQLHTKVSGSGNMSLELEAKYVTTHISGSGDIEMAGLSGSLETRISGSGSLTAFDLETSEATIRISGSGNCRIHARDTLDVRINGSGDVEYKGNPKVNLSGSGSGSVRSK